MKNLFVFLSITMVLLLTACGGNKYDDAINDVISQEKKYHEEEGLDTKNIKREKSIVSVYDGGKYIKIAYYLNEAKEKISSYDYYEKLGDKYKEMEHMPGSGEGDRLGLYKKTPEYEEVKGKETKLEE
ncbi:cystatin-like fold lipoprotein [Bacillus atrophaeus]|uniref:cystatin-like fold lipoprotein n=1 Tax=Bacillus atrophaeus TaxID=1452 RepID=UPI0022808439|nr:cystatin-like fold lipoprotein [Bacillus atrophaeus]MCY8949621.1 DUF4467 domain-containing protein [Bacillus atrophaeus]MCY8960064.1 DUF4467 domain-containing protein [Bacillus atrophaeus]MCY8965311.1 DUF4467 domain-containing protein [Bacillus atrophaeus]MCY9439159.1 DUF4467 domain-containing protein [Bacillus atrophaeus]MEC0650080.1 cystatin-like fold lipoprotein [Bacillus atrophaeus]